MTQVLLSPDALIAAIRARHNERLTLEWLMIRKFEPDLIQAANEHFGSWHAAILEAGLDLKVTYTTNAEAFSPLPKKRRVPATYREKGVEIQLDEPKNKGLAWWSILSPRAKEAVVQDLIDKGMSSGFIARYLDLGSRNRVVGVRDRVVYPNRLRRAVSFDAPLYNDSKTTTHDTMGAVDSGFEQFEWRQLLSTLLARSEIEGDAAVLLQRLLSEGDLEDEEYGKLASTIREHPDLMKIVTNI